MRNVQNHIRKIATLPDEELMSEAKDMGAPIDLLYYIKKHGKIPVPIFSAGGIATPADASLLMQLGADTVFVGSGIFMSEDPERRAKAIVEAATHFKDPAVLRKISEGLGTAMSGIDVASMPDEERMAKRGW